MTTEMERGEVARRCLRTAVVGKDRSEIVPVYVGTIRDAISTPVERGTAEDDVAGLVANARDHTIALSVGCCSCGAKSPEPRWHADHCKVWSAANALDTMDSIADLIEALTARLAASAAETAQAVAAAYEDAAKVVEGQADMIGRIMAAGWRGNPHMSGDDRNFMHGAQRRRHDDQARYAAEHAATATRARAPQREASAPVAREDGVRKAFEAWVNATPYARCSLARGNDKVFGAGYTDVKTSLAWDAWRAALETPPRAAVAQGEAVAFMASDRLRSITQVELNLIPNEDGRRDRCKAMYRIPLYALASADAARLGEA